MMIAVNLLRAEWQKITGNKMLVSFTLWIYPVGAAMFILSMGLLDYFVDSLSNPFVAQEWTAAYLSGWQIMLSFPVNVLARLPIIAAMALAFAGEYEWGTWKNILPRVHRAWIIIAKFVVMATLVCLTLGAMTLLWGTGRVIIASAMGYEFGPALTGEVLADFVGQYLLEAALTFMMSMVLVGFTALAVLLSRSVIGGLLLGFGLALLEGLSGLLLELAGSLFDRTELVNLYRFMPAYSVDNIRSWVLNDTPLIAGANFSVEPTLTFSVIVLVLWAVGITGLIAWVFERQDLA